MAIEYAQKTEKRMKTYEFKCCKAEELMAKINADWADDLKKKHKKYLIGK